VASPCHYRWEWEDCKIRPNNNQNSIKPDHQALDIGFSFLISFSSLLFLSQVSHSNFLSLAFYFYHFLHFIFYQSTTNQTVIMQFTNYLALALATAGAALAAPAAEPAVATDMMDRAASWTLQGFKRACNEANNSCTYTYKINAHAGAVPDCKYTIKGAAASKKSYDNVKCGAYVISSNWSGQFGADKGFQTLSVKKGNLIIYPSYTDAELKGGKIVKPNKSYAPQTFLS
jgi:hypothetical protein